VRWFDRWIDHTLRCIWLEPCPGVGLKAFILWSIGPFAMVLYHDFDNQWYRNFASQQYIERDWPDTQGALLVVDERVAA